MLRLDLRLGWLKMSGIALDTPLFVECVRVGHPVARHALLF